MPKQSLSQFIQTHYIFCICITSAFGKTLREFYFVSIMFICICIINTHHTTYDHDNITVGFCASRAERCERASTSLSLRFYFNTFFFFPTLPSYNLVSILYAFFLNSSIYRMPCIKNQIQCPCQKPFSDNLL